MILLRGVFAGPLLSGPTALIERLNPCHVMKERPGGLSSLITGPVKLHPGITQTNRETAFVSENNTQACVLGSSETLAFIPSA